MVRICVYKSGVKKALAEDKVEVKMKVLIKTLLFTKTLNSNLVEEISL
jgi:hypothetical protein